jgi:hypothetical protein
LRNEYIAQLTILVISLTQFKANNAFSDLDLDQT